MPQPSPDLSRLFLEWLQQRQQGHSVSAEDLSSETPVLIDELKQQIGTVEWMERQVGVTLVTDGARRQSADGTRLTEVGVIASSSDGTAFDQGMATSNVSVSPPGYEFLAELGRGGMGVVFKARDLSLNRIVAVKMVLGGGLASPNALARFMAEAEALAALQHPNVVHVFERGQHQGLPYFVMEYCPGGSLGGRVRDNPLPARAAAELVEQLARGVAAAHASNILHRDLKPENVLFTADGTPKISDFGLAKRLDSSTTPALTPDAGERGGARGPSDDITQSGAVLGTPSYMAPEQAMGESKRVGPASDVYSLGALLFRILTGRSPFLGANAADTLRQVVGNEPLSPRQLVPSLPRDLATICLKCLEKTPSRRYASANELADDLRRFLDGRPIEARPVGRIERSIKWVKRNPIVTGSTLAVFLALAGGAAVSYWNYREANQQAVEATNARNAEADRVRERDAALRKAGDALDRELERVKERDKAIIEANAARKAESDRVKERDKALVNANEAIVKEGERVKERDKAIKEADLRADELKYQLGISNMVLASAAYDNRDVMLADERLDKVLPAQRGWEWYYLKRQIRGGISTLYRHTGAVTCVACSPDGTRIATGSKDQTVRIWDARNGLPLFEWKQHRHWVTSVAFSADGLRLVTGSADWTARIWNVRAGTPYLELKGHSGRVTGAAFSPDGTRVVTSSEDRTARLWDARTGAMLFEWKGHANAVACIAFSPDGAQVVSGGLDSLAIVWDARNGSRLFDLTLPSRSSVGCAAFSPDGTRIAIAGQGATVYDTRNGSPLVDLNGHSGIVLGVNFSPDATRIVTGSADRTAKIWDARTGASINELKGHTNSVSSAAFSPDGMRVVTGSHDETVKVWDARSNAASIEISRYDRFAAWSPDGFRFVTGGAGTLATVWDGRTGSRQVDLNGFTESLNGASFSPDGKYVAAGCDDKTAKVWDAQTGTLLVEMKGHTGTVNSAAFSPDGTRLITCGNDQSARVWDARMGMLLYTLRGHKGNVFVASFSPDGTRIVTSSANLTNVWDAQTKTRIVELKGHTNTVLSAAFSPDGLRIVTGSIDQTAKLWDVRTGTLLVDLKGHTELVTCVAFSPDGTRILTGGNDRIAKVWDARTGIPLFDLKGQPSQLSSVSFSSDGTRALTLGGTARIWDARSFTPIIELRGHADVVACSAFSVDGKRIVSGSLDKTAKVWDAQTGMLLADLKGHQDRIGIVAFSPDGSRVITGSWDKTARIWNSRTGTLLHELKGHAAELSSALFSIDGSKVVTVSGDQTTKVWDAESGMELAADLFPATIRPRPIAPDGKTIANANGNRLDLVPLNLSAQEFAHRMLHTRPQLDHHREAFQLARLSKDSFAMRFHVDRILSIVRNDADLRLRNQIHPDPRVIARTSFHHKPLAKAPYDHTILQTLAMNGDRLARRLVAQELIRDGQPRSAIPLLFECMLARSSIAPPVEELLLAHAFLDINQLEEAKRFYRAATDWLGQPCQPIRAANIASHCALNAWAAIGQAFVPVDDPRRNPVEWEAWHECDLFRAEVEHRLTKP